MYKRYYKRTLDIVASASALLVLAVPMGIISLWLHFANKGAGIFFFQERPGKKSKIFKIWKFKSMTDEKDSNGELLPNEQRITKAGRFIRKYSIDELPQLFNVLKGDMSLIGPRPLPIRYLELYSPSQARRHEVRPGVTGWAQVNGRNNISWTKKFEYDVFYVDNVSLGLDIKIFFKTIKKVLSSADINAGEEKIGGVGFDGTN